MVAGLKPARKRRRGVVAFGSEAARANVLMRSFTEEDLKEMTYALRWRVAVARSRT